MILNFFPLLKLPFGGKITLGQSVPLIFFSFKRGFKNGIRAGALCSILKIIFFSGMVFAVNAVSFIFIFIMEYFLPYLFTAVSSCCVHFLNKKRIYLIISCFFSHVFKFFCLFISGVIFWNDCIPNNLNIWFYSFIYNFSYMFPETILACIITYLITDYIF